MTLDQVYDELYGEIDQIKNELKNTLAQIQYASNFTEGISLGTLSVGAESSQVIAPHVALLPGAESGMMLLDLPVGTESAMLPALIQDDPEATELVPDAIPTGKTMESVLNSNLSYKELYNGTPTTADTFQEVSLGESIDNFVFIALAIGQYSNVTETCVLPVAYFKTLTNANARVILNNAALLNARADIYYTSSTKVTYKMSYITGGIKMRIWGYIRKG